jgi:L-ascorbate metabolism protein UlaG (beta-lactamase superfamily)
MGRTQPEDGTMTATHEIRLTGGETSPDMTYGSLFFVGTATVLIRYAGFTILTDPNFIHMHEQVDLGGGLKATRLTNPAMEIGDLPPIDLIVLSHFHGDHFDQVAVRELDKGLPIVTTPESAGELRERGFTNLYPIETWTSANVVKGDARLRITATPARHGPAVVSFVLPDVMGSILEFQSNGSAPLFRLYITGDTIMIDKLEEIPRRYPDIDLALVHLGGTRVMGLLLTMDGDQGVQLLQIVEPKLAIPIHYNDYDVFKSPLSDFKEAVAAAGLENRVHYLSHGDSYAFTVPANRLAEAHAVGDPLASRPLHVEEPVLD